MKVAEFWDRLETTGNVMVVDHKTNIGNSILQYILEVYCQYVFNTFSNISAIYC